MFARGMKRSTTAGTYPIRLSHRIDNSVGDISTIDDYKGTGEFQLHASVVTVIDINPPWYRLLFAIRIHQPLSKEAWLAISEARIPRDCVTPDLLFLTFSMAHHDGHAIRDVHMRPYWPGRVQKCFGRLDSVNRIGIIVGRIHDLHVGQALRPSEARIQSLDIANVGKAANEASVHVSKVDIGQYRIGGAAC